MVLFHIAELYIIYRYMHCFYVHEHTGKTETSSDRPSTVIKHLMAYMVYFAAVCLGDILSISTLEKFMADTFFLYLLAQLYHGKQGKKLLATFSIQGMNLFCETLAVYMLYDCKVDGEYGREMYYIIFLFMYVCERVMEKFCIKNIKEDSSLRHWDLLIFMPVISVIMVFVLIVFDSGNKYAGSAVSAGLICLNLSVFYICDELAGAYIKLQENALARRQLESYSNQLDVVMKSEEKVRGLRHDLKHHLNEILMMADKGRMYEIVEYVQTMQKDMLNEKEHISSGNADIDSLINLMLERAKKELEDVKCRVCVPRELDISSFDWNIILGNLLDNAIDAARRSKDKLLHIKISYQRGMLLIGIKNSYSGELIKTGESYISTKDYDRADESQIHGLGIKNVRRIVEKYNGSMEIDDADGIFNVKILMYAPLKKV